MNIKINDFVEVISGKEKKKQGTVLKVLPKSNRVVVEGINLRTRHKKNNNEETSPIKVESPIHISNVQLICPKTKKPTRIRYEVQGDNKVRVSVKSGAIIK